MTDAVQRWAAGLAPARLAGGTIAAPPEPIGLAQGYALADAAAAALGTPAGWKVGATSDAAMAFLAVGQPIRGRLFAERLWRDGDRAPLSGDRVAEAEPEIAFRLRCELRPGDDPAAAVAEVRAAAEIVRPSHGDPFALGVGFIVADNAAGLGALLGPLLPLDALADPAGLRLALAVEGGSGTEGAADAVLGDPLRALAWLAGHLGVVAAGSWVLSGAMARAVPLLRGAGGGKLRLDAGRHGAAILHY
jgi:2-keto-4-pentenoate hydratase